MRGRVLKELSYRFVSYYSRALTVVKLDDYKVYHTIIASPLTALDFESCVIYVFNDSRLQ